jgi:DNA gyrase subunit A
MELLYYTKEGELLEAKLTNGESQIIYFKSGKLVRFEETKPVQWEELLLVYVNNIKRRCTDEVIGMVTVNDMNSEILEAENGYANVPV